MKNTKITSYANLGLKQNLHDFRAWVRNSRQMKIRRHLKY